MAVSSWDEMAVSCWDELAVSCWDEMAVSCWDEMAVSCRVADLMLSHICNTKNMYKHWLMISMYSGVSRIFYGIKILHFFV